MIEVGETLPSNPVEQLNMFVSDERTRLEAVSEFLAEAMPLVKDLDESNKRLTEAGRSDLVITKPAKLMELDDPLEVLEKCNNFTPNFQVSTGFRTREEDMTEYRLPPREHSDPIPVTKEELDSVVTGSLTFKDPSGSHVRKPAYERMFILFPDFTRKLTLEFSEQGYGKLFERYRAELFAAYHVMSQLVDQDDQYVMQDGEVDTWYLCR